MPRIVFVCNSLRLGGSQSVLLQLVETAVGMGWEAVVASKGGELRPAFEERGARCVDLLMREGVARPAHPASPVEIAKTSASVAGAVRLAALTAGPTPTVVHASQPWPLAVASLASGWTRRPLVWHAHGTTSVETPPAAPGLVLPRLTRVVAVTPEVADAVACVVGATPVDVLPNPVAEVPPAPHPAAGELVAGMCGTLMPNKARGIAAVIDACASVARERPVRLLVVGDGPERPALEVRAAEAAAASRLRVEFAGAHADPWAPLAPARVVVGVGLVAVEAAMRGHRVVVAGSDGMGGFLTATGAERLFETNYTGRGVAPLDAASLASALVRADTAEDAEVAQARQVLVDRHGRGARRAFEELWRDVLRREGEA